MFQLEDLRKTRVWQEAQEEEREHLVEKWLAKGMTLKEIATLLDVPVQAVRRMIKNGKN